MKVREKLVQDLKSWYLDPEIKAGKPDDIMTEFMVLSTLKGELQDQYLEDDDDDPVFDLYRAALGTHLAALKRTILDSEI